MIWEIKKRLPFSYESIIKKHLGFFDASVLDLGCGNGRLMVYLARKRRLAVVGVEAYQPFAQEARRTGVYKKVISGDVRKVTFQKKTFDVVICCQVLEYLTKEEGEKLIERCESIAKKRVIITAYIGNPAHEKAQRNPFQTSTSSWYPNELSRKGYKVYGQGLRLLYREKGYPPKKLTPVKVVIMVLAYLTSPFVYYFPSFATHMICIKALK